MNTAAAKSIPSGYLQNAQGHLVPLELIPELDLTRDELVMETIDKARALQDAMVEFKTSVMDDIAAFVQLSAERYQAQLGGDKGNVTLTSYCGRYRLVRANADHLVFDERLQVAKEMVDSCIRRWAAGASAEVRALVQHAFQTDKAGKVNTARVLGLTQLKIDDAEWQQAMQAIKDSMHVSSSKSYVRLYERIGESDQWRALPLDIAAL